MIKKFFIVGKQLYLQGKSVDAYQDLGRVIEVNFSLEAFWEVESLIKEANFLLASGESTSELLRFYRKVFAKTAPFAVREKERAWLNEKSRETK